MSFSLELLEILVFPQREGRMNTNVLPLVLSTFWGNLRVTLVLMPLTEMFGAFTACSRGYNVFKICNMLLQVWATEHFFQREPTIDYFVCTSKMIHIHEKRMRHWGAPHGQEELCDLLNHLIGDIVNWKLSWLYRQSNREVSKTYLIELMGLEVIQPYAPLRVLRQFGTRYTHIVSNGFVRG